SFLVSTIATRVSPDRYECNSVARRRNMSDQRTGMDRHLVPVPGLVYPPGPYIGVPIRLNMTAPPMNLRDDPTTFRTGVATIGEPLLRSEDPKLLRGEGRYTDDVELPGQAHCVMLRSRHAHGVIRSINTEAARNMPGMLAVYTGADLAGYGPMKSGLPFKSRDGSEMRRTGRPALATDKGRFVGDPI